MYVRITWSTSPGLPGFQGTRSPETAARPAARGATSILPHYYATVSSFLPSFPAQNPSSPRSLKRNRSTSDHHRTCYRRMGMLTIAGVARPAWVSWRISAAPSGVGRSRRAKGSRTGSLSTSPARLRIVGEGLQRRVLRVSAEFRVASESAVRSRAATWLRPPVPRRRGGVTARPLPLNPRLRPR